MTIRDVLEADWRVNEIQVTVRDQASSIYIMQYRIGRDVKPGRSEKFLYETKCGDMYTSNGMKTLIMKRIIQFRQLEKRPRGEELCVGVLLEKIPKKILELKINNMSPERCGNSDEMHGYSFDCYVDAWNGIAGENKAGKG